MQRIRISSPDSSRSRHTEGFEPPVRSAAIIAGGASRRMGQTKALLHHAGAPLVAHIAGVLRPLFENIVIVTCDGEISRAAGLPSVADVYQGKGPLGGIHAALRHFQAPVFCVACDLPFLNADAIRFLCAQIEIHDAVLPRIGGRLQPLHAVYAPSCLATFEEELLAGRARRMGQVLASLEVRFLEEAAWQIFDEPLKIFTNLNTPEEARAAGFSL